MSRPAASRPQVESAIQTSTVAMLAAEKRAVLVPAAGDVGRGSAEIALRRRKCGPLAGIRGDERPQTDPLEGLDDLEQHARRLDRPDPAGAARQHPAPERSARIDGATGSNGVYQDSASASRLASGCAL